MATQMTPKQCAFIANKAAGMTNEAAAIAAGYSPNGAKVAANTILKKPGVKAAIKKAAAKVVPSDNDITRTLAQNLLGVPPTDDGMPRSQYADSKDFLVDTMNNRAIPFAQRQKAATDLMPYQHARIGEKGKKENKHDAAKEIHGGKFKPQKSPTLATVTSIHGR